jgi:hypothetical protein
MPVEMMENGGSCPTRVETLIANLECLPKILTSMNMELELLCGCSKLLH